MNNYSSKQQIINRAIKFHLEGDIAEATKYYKFCIIKGFNDSSVFSNYGAILQSLGKLEEAAQLYRKAIELNPDFANAYSNLGNVLRDLGKLEEAEIYIRKAIELNSNFAEAYSNLGNVLKNLGKLEEAEISYNKAIELNSNFAEAYSNLGSILKILGKFKEAEISYNKAIKLKPNLSIAFYSLSTLKLSNDKTIWQDQLFSENILNNQLEKDQVNIYFARANILHKESRFKESSKYLQLANNLKEKLNKSNVEDLLNKSRNLLFESNRELIIKNENTNFIDNIFIIGMPRSGSTLIESILSMNNNVKDLGEKNIFEESFLTWKNPSQKSTLAELYLQKTKIYSKELRTTTNKWLHNYQYAGIIASHIPNAKIIHCFRNPLDNLLSIYRAHFAVGYEYSSSLVNSAKVYLDHEEVMTEYKMRFKEKIYDLNYDSLVRNPNKEIKSLISWLGWKWDEKYLSPHLNPRSVSTASAIQVRYPINTKSIGGWKNYKKMLKPAIEIITQIERYKTLI